MPPPPAGQPDGDAVAVRRDRLVVQPALDVLGQGAGRRVAIRRVAGHRLQAEPGSESNAAQICCLLVFPSNNQPNFSLALRATSALGVFVGGNLSRHDQGRQASMIATE